MECGSSLPLFLFRGRLRPLLFQNKPDRRSLESITYEMLFCKSFPLIFIQNHVGVGGHVPTRGPLC